MQGWMVTQMKPKITHRATKKRVTYKDGALEAGLHENEVLGGEVHDQGNKGGAEHGHGTTDAHHLLLVHPIRSCHCKNKKIKRLLDYF